MHVNGGNATGRVYLQEPDLRGGDCVEPAGGLEPPTYRLQGDCSAN